MPEENSKDEALSKFDPDGPNVDPISARLRPMRTTPAEVVEIKYAHWTVGDDCYNCSGCGHGYFHGEDTNFQAREVLARGDGRVYKICPFCGAYMTNADGEEDYDYGNSY